MVVLLLHLKIEPRCCGAMESDLGVVAVTANDRASAILDATSETPTFLDKASGLHVWASGRDRMSADALSDVLRTVRLTGAAYFDVVARNPWVAEQPTREMVLPKILPGAEHLISYHVITEGRCFAGIVGGEAIAVDAGEVIVFTRGDPHVVSSDPGMRAQPVTQAEVDAATSGPLPFFRSLGGEGPPSVKMTCGFLACDASPFNPLLDNLPPVIKSGNPRDRESNWLGHFIRLARAESTDKRAGGEGVLAKLSELMFIEVVRRHVETLPPEQAGWLAGLRDPFVGKALSLMHGDAARNWTIEELAKEVALSRSVLAERFADLVGMPPMHYLAKWRMQIAAGLLSGGNTNMATIAAEIGYGSEAAFSRAFKKTVGVPPSAWRRRPGQAASRPM
jgi:AraC-like DNA-binding protein